MLAIAFGAIACGTSPIGAGPGTIAPVVTTGSSPEQLCVNNWNSNQQNKSLMHSNITGQGNDITASVGLDSNGSCLVTVEWTRFVGSAAIPPVPPEVFAFQYAELTPQDQADRGDLAYGPHYFIATWGGAGTSLAPSAAQWNATVNFSKDTISLGAGPATGNGDNGGSVMPTPAYATH
jgi:hypothetical protein